MSLSIPAGTILPICLLTIGALRVPRLVTIVLVTIVSAHEGSTCAVVC